MTVRELGLFLANHLPSKMNFTNVTFEDEEYGCTRTVDSIYLIDGEVVLKSERDYCLDYCLLFSTMPYEEVMHGPENLVPNKPPIFGFIDSSCYPSHIGIVDNPMWVDEALPPLDEAIAGGAYAWRLDPEQVAKFNDALRSHLYPHSVPEWIEKVERIGEHED